MTMLISACGGGSGGALISDPASLLDGGHAIYGGGTADRDSRGALTAGITPVTCMAAGAPDGIDCVDTAYSGRWGWRGTSASVGTDGPRGVAVAPWGATTSLAAQTTHESLNMGNFGNSPFTHDPLGAIGVRQAHALGVDGSGVVVAVVDGRIYEDHFELDNGKVIGTANASSNPGITPNYDDHGTHIAGIIAAEKNGGASMHGVAPGASLFGISLSENADGSLDINRNNLAAGIRTATSQGARIFNNSWGTAVPDNSNASFLDDPTLVNAMADAVSEGAVFVWAAGNAFDAFSYLGEHNTSQEAKAALQHSQLADGFVNVVNVVYDSSVGEWVISNSLSNASNEAGSQICGVTRDYCLAAPGTYIGSAIYGDGTGASFGVLSGTSMAAPMVSGGLAILFQAFPYVETSDILELLFATADDLGAPGVDDIYGHGMMNLAAALQPSGSMHIATSNSIQTNVGISPAATSFIGDSAFSNALSTAARDMVLLDTYDRAYRVGAAGIGMVRDPALSSADSLAQSLSNDFEALARFGAPVTRVMATSGALAQIHDEVTLGAHQLRYEAIVKDGSGSVEMQVIAHQSGEQWRTSRLLAVTQEAGQLFGNVGTGAYALSDQATTLTLATQGSRSLDNGWVVFGGLGLSQTHVDPADGSLIQVSDRLSAASAVVGLRRAGLGAQGRGEFALQMGQDRRVFEGSALVRIPVARAQGGVIVFEETRLTAGDLSLDPHLELSYQDWIGEDTTYAVSAIAQQGENLLSVDLVRAF